MSTYRVIALIAFTCGTCLWAYWTGRLHEAGETWADCLREAGRALTEEDPEILKPWARPLARWIQGRRGEGHRG